MSNCWQVPSFAVQIQFCHNGIDFILVAMNQQSIVLCAWIGIFRLSIPFLPLCPITLMPHKSWPLGRTTSIALLDMLQRILSNACLPSSNHPLCRNIKRAPLPIIFLCSTKYTMYSWQHRNQITARLQYSLWPSKGFCDFLELRLWWFWIRNKTLCIASSRKGNGYSPSPSRLRAFTPKCALSVTFCIIITCFSQKTGFLKILWRSCGFLRIFEANNFSYIW